jgi:cytidylate kinase
MSIITISRGSYSKGKEIAEKVAAELDYECVSRDILLEASEQFNTPEIKLVRALHDAPSVLNKFTHGKERFVAYIQEALLSHFQRDNVVYHGLAGHFFLKGVGHALKVRIIADLEDRVRHEMERENISEEQALKVLQKDDDERRRWALTLYGVDTADTSLYDLCIHIRKITVNDAVQIICHTARLPHFETTPASQKTLDDLALSARVQSAIVGSWPDARVVSDDGRVVIHVEAPRLQEQKVCSQIAAIAAQIDGVREVSVNASPSAFLGFE